MTTETTTLDHVVPFIGPNSQDNSATSGERVRSRTPRELLRKVPRRVSMGLDSASSSRGPTPSSDGPSPPAQSRSPTPPALSPKLAAAMDVAEPSVVKDCSENDPPPPSVSHDISEPVMMKASLPILSPRLTKPTATKAAALDIDGTKTTINTSPLKPMAVNTNTNAPSSFHFTGNYSNVNANPSVGGASMVYQKPSDPLQEQVVRKQLMLQSRRQSFPGVSGGRRAKEAIAMAKLQPVMMAAARPWRQNQVALAFRSSGLGLSYGFSPRPFSGKHKAVPVRGWRNGQYIWTGIVERTDGFTGQKAYYKLDDPRSMYFYRNYHLMGYNELTTELACYRGDNYACSKGIMPMKVMNLKTGLPLLPSARQQQSTRDMWSTTPLPHQSPGAFGAHPSFHHDSNRWAKSLSPATVSAAASAAAAAIDPSADLIDDASPFGLAEISGKETLFQTDPDMHLFSTCFPYIGRDTAQVSVQAIRALDEIKVIVYGRDQRIEHEPMWMTVVSVSSFGQITATPKSVSRLSPQTLHPKAFVSFPSTCVVGVCHGKFWKPWTKPHWASTGTQQLSQA